MTCTDCGIPVAPRPQGKGVTPPPAGTRYHQGRGLCSRCYSREQRRNPEPRKRQRACNVEAALKGECTCPACNLANTDRESPMNAGAGVPERNGVRRWV